MSEQVPAPPPGLPPPPPPTGKEAGSRVDSESMLEMMKELAEANERLYAHSILTPKEAAVYGWLKDFAIWHQTPSLLKYCNEQLKHKMSIEGKRVDQMVHPYKRAEEKSGTSLKDKIITLGG